MTRIDLVKKLIEILREDGNDAVKIIVAREPGIQNLEDLTFEGTEFDFEEE